MPSTPANTKTNSAQEWASSLTCAAAAILMYESITGLTILLLPFSLFNQFAVLLHTAIGLVSLAPITTYSCRHWQIRRHGSFNHYQLLGYGSILFFAVCALSGIVLTVQALIGIRIDALWDWIHLASGLAFLILLAIHIGILALRGGSESISTRDLQLAKLRFYRRTALGCGALFVMTVLPAVRYPSGESARPFSPDYHWRFGDDRPFAPSLARLDCQNGEDRVVQAVLKELEPSQHKPFLEAFHINEKDRQGFRKRIADSLADINALEAVEPSIQSALDEFTYQIQQRGAVSPDLLAGSESCGTAGCHKQIYQEWLPSAHRYSSLDHLFQRTQEFMAEETSPEQTRYCAGCHDPISLFAGAKNQSNITLSAKGADEGGSCIVCHSIVQTDTQGNADYTLRPPTPYFFEKESHPAARWLSHFLIRAYPRHHVESYSRPLYKSPEYCGACHKQYIDKEVNTDIGRVQGQNQYDSWRKSRWFDEANPRQSLTCRECHMPLQDSQDPSSGDPSDFNRSRSDRKHRSHRFLASNQYIPLYHDLPNAELHTKLTEQWLRGEYDIPEIADRWTNGPAVQIEIAAPSSVKAGAMVPIQVILVNNKAGHDFPTGPLDMIESWLEVKVTSSTGEIAYHAGALDAGNDVLESPVIFKSIGFDRKGDLIDRHNLWDLVGAKYKRSMFPGFTDTVNLEVFCPSIAKKHAAQSPVRSAAFEMILADTVQPGYMTIEAILWYRKANAVFLRRIYGVDTPIRAPITDISRAVSELTIEG
ncbi:MAG: DUF4405 domain-containing protein [Candidatus Omnitrophota bacterium]